MIFGRWMQRNLTGQMVTTLNLESKLMGLIVREIPPKCQTPKENIMIL